MKEIIIIGGGASGLTSAIYAAKKGYKVTIIEKNKILGKKILLTGNGKCNYWNKSISLDNYNTDDKEKLNIILKDNNKKEIQSLFDTLGIIPKIRDNYYYPYSNQATSIQTTLIKECQINKVKIITECEVKDIKKDNDIFIINTSNGLYKTKKLIISTGSLAYPKTGSTGEGYEFAKKLGHKIIKPLPALVQLISSGQFLKEWQGIRSDVSVTLKENNEILKKEIGEIQLTDYGVSGICIFNLSSIASRKLSESKFVTIEINFLHPFSITKESDFINWMNKRNTTMKERTIPDLLDGVLNYKLINMILKLSNIKREERWNTLNKDKKKLLADHLTKFTLNIENTKSFDNAQTTTGGIPLQEINPNTMESTKCKGLYFTGEILNVDGDCGGYNLAFAWITGMLAGKGASND